MVISEVLKLWSTSPQVGLHAPDILCSPATPAVLSHLAPLHRKAGEGVVWEAGDLHGAAQYCPQGCGKTEPHFQGKNSCEGESCT